MNVTHIPKILSIIFVIIIAAFSFSGSAVYAATCPAGGEHEYKITVIKKPTETKSGLERYTCLKCGDTYEGSVPKTGHSFSGWIVETSATCIDEGISYKVCSKCGKKEYKTTSPTGKHKFGSWVTVQKLTEHQDGIERSTCSLCGSTKTRTVKMVGGQEQPQTPTEEKLPEKPTGPVIEQEEPEIEIGPVNVPESGGSGLNAIDAVAATANLGTIALFAIFIRRDMYVINWDKARKLLQMKK